MIFYFPPEDRSFLELNPITHTTIPAVLQHNRNLCRARGCTRSRVLGCPAQLRNCPTTQPASTLLQEFDSWASCYEENCDRCNRQQPKVRKQPKIHQAQILFKDPEMLLIQTRASQIIPSPPPPPQKGKYLFTISRIILVDKRDSSQISEKDWKNYP